MTGEKKTPVLFPCAGNSCRSQMAEGFARQMGAEVIEAYSAGTNPAGINSRAVQAMKETGIDLLAHFSKPVEAIDQKRIEVVVTLSGPRSRSQKPREKFA